MDDTVKQTLEKTIQLADQVTEVAHKTKNLASRLRQAARESSDLFERLTRRIIEETEVVLHTALSLALNCGTNNIILKHVFRVILVAKFPNVSSQLDDSIANVSWLLNVSAPAGNRSGEFLHLPPLAARNPILFDIWEKIAILYTGSLKDRSEVTASFIDASFIDNNDSYCKLFVEEGGVSPLLKLLKDGIMEEQEDAARAIGFLGSHPESVKHMMDVGTCSIFANILKEGSMEVQALVASAVSKLAENYPKCQDLFAQHNIIRLLVDHLAFVTLQDRPVSRIYEQHRRNHRMKEMASLALWLLVKGNPSICHSIVKSKALSCFVVLLEKGPKDAQYNSAMAVMEITAVAEKEADLRESAFHPNSSSYKAIVGQMLKTIKKANPKLVIPCIKTIGNLAKAATNTRIIGPLVTVLRSNSETEVTTETLIALTKYVCTENDLHMDHSNAIINAGGTAEYLVRLVYLGKQSVQVRALILLSYLVLHIPHRDELAQTSVLGVLEWASSDETSITRDEVVDELLLESQSRLKLYLSRILKGFDGSLISHEDT